MQQKNGLKRLYALGRMKAGKMNKTETAYAEHLKLMQAAGEILWWRFEGMKFKLADNTFYTPDFTVLCADGTLEAHEVKGYMLEDANVKVKVAAEMYPLRFIIVRVKPKKDGGGWRFSEVGNGN